MNFSKMSLWSSLNRNVFKRTSTMAVAVAGGTFFFERTFDLLSNSLFESINKGVSILLCNSRAPELALSILVILQDNPFLLYIVCYNFIYNLNQCSSIACQILPITCKSMRCSSVWYLFTLLDSLHLMKFITFSV